ncbi:MAG: PIN domain-containing protein [Terriglobales bacterium]
MAVEPRLARLLQRHRRIALDASVFIYQLEGNPKYLTQTKIIFSWLELPASRAVTSTITMTELLVVPYRDGDAQLADDFNALLSVYPNLDWIPPNLEIADLAARIRALHGLKTPDALQAATAINMQATAFVTNDKIFERVGAFDTIILDRLL